MAVVILCEDSMKGHTLFCVFVVVTFIYLGECQITFSRAWVRGSKLPAEEKRVVSEGGNEWMPTVNKGAELSLFRGAAVPDADNALLFPRDSKLRSLIQSLVQKWKYQTASRFKWGGSSESLE